MKTRVVCISRTIAAGGEAVGEIVASRLGFRYVDEEIISRAANQAQVDAKLVAAVEQRKPLLDRLLDKLPTAHDVAGAVTLSTGVPVDIFTGGVVEYRAVSDDMRVVIRAAIHEVAQAGQAVIVAHAASMALAGSEGVLRVLVTASAAVRTERLVAAQGLAKPAAETAVASSDRDRREYLKRFYGVKEELPTHYDLVLNTDVLPAEQAAAIIVAAAGSGGPEA
jgi:cytidylate kinase